MNVVGLLAQLEESNVTLSTRDNELIVHGKRHALTTSLLDLLRENKEELIELIEAGGYAGSGTSRRAERADEHATTKAAPKLTDLAPAEVERIASTVTGGAANIQDAYPLMPLQEGILFHHLLEGNGDPYLGAVLLRFDSRERLDRFVVALQGVIDRHDSLRTAVLWEGLRDPLQVVWRRAPLAVEEVQLDAEAGDVAEQLRARFSPRHYRLDIRRAPVMGMFIAEDTARNCWNAVWLRHHVTVDQTTRDVILREVEAHLLGRQWELPEPLPFRDFVARARTGVSREEHETYFRELLGDVETPTTPFGLTDVHGDASNTIEGQQSVYPSLVRRLGARARASRVSVATLCHLAFALVLARISNRDDVVFGTVLFGRTQAGDGADSIPGLFVNTLPVRIGVDRHGVEPSVRSVHAQLTRLLRHEHASLALAQRCSAVPPPAPLFSAVLNYSNDYRKRPDGPSADEARAWDGISILSGEGRTSYPFGLTVVDSGKDLYLRAQVHAPLDPERICGYMHTALEQIVKALEHTPEMAVGDLEVLPESERRRLLVEWNDTRTEHSKDRCIHQLFEEHAERAPNEVALVSEGGRLSYAELNAQANRLARHLRALGVGPDRIVAICVERGLDMVVSVLGTLKAGGAYLPLDPGLPFERLSFMLTDSAPAAVLTHGDVGASVRRMLVRVSEGANVPLIDLSANAAWAANGEKNLDRSSLGITADNLAYVIYTSGSTGTPKGVMVHHRGALNVVAGTRACTVARDSHVMQFAAFGFDACAWEMVMALCNGAELHLPPTALVGAELAEFARQHSITHLTLPPAVLAGVPRGPGLETLQTLVVAGEAATGSLVQSWATGRQFFNAYGPTETSVCATMYECHPDQTGDPPIGRPIADVSTYILDERLQPVPIDVSGELYIGGAGVARGYLNRAGLTAERFAPDPFAQQVGARMYRTGDLAKYRRDGTMEFLGRADFQVKVRGFRIEPGEIEARLREYPGIGEAVVIAREDDTGDKRLVVYYTLAEQEAGPTIGVEELRAHLLEVLPAYMVPSAYVQLKDLPLTRNGKVDRKGLPAPGDQAYGARGYEAPIGETETILAGIWSEVLGIERIGRHDNFFELGGHSLFVVRVIERMRRAGLHAEAETLFTSPTLTSLATAVGRSNDKLAEVPPNRIPAGCAAITPEMLPLVALTAAEIERVVDTVPGGSANVQDIYPLAPLQEGMLFHHMLGDNGDPYLGAVLLGFENRDQIDRFVEALQGVIDRHDILRTAVLWEGLRQPVQVVWRHARLTVENVELDASAGDAAEQLRARFHPKHYRIDVRRAPVMQLFVAEDKVNDRWVLFWLRHHLSGDQTTGEVMYREVQAHLSGMQGELREPIPFRNFVAQSQLGISRDEHEVFFRALLGDVEEPTSPFGLVDVRGDNSEPGEARRQVDASLARRLRMRARALGVSAATLCHLAFARVLGGVAGREDVVFGTVLFGRMHGGEGADWIPGLFINTLPVRIRVGGDSVEQSVKGVHAQLARLLRHEHAPLAIAQRCSAVAAPAPLFSALLNYRHNQSDAHATRGTEQTQQGAEFLGSEGRTNYPFTLSVDETVEGFSLKAQVQAPLDPSRICEYMHTALERIVDALERAPEMPMRDVEILPEDERRRLLVEWNDTATVYPQDRCIHELFEEQVGKRPHAEAVSFQGQRLTYSQLNQRANRLAWYLRAAGTEPGESVVLVMPRGLNMIVGQLAILKCGASYVPIDPEFPDDRRQLMISDCGATRVLASEARQLSEGRTGAAWIDVDEVVETLDSYSAIDPQISTDSGTAAYVMYTSGSTGRPKGVVVSHRAVVSRVVDCGYVEVGPDDCVAHCSNPAFDASTFEVWSGLLSGARLLVVSPDAVLEPKELARTLLSENVTALHLTTGLFNQCADALAEVYARLKYLMFGGEAWDPKTVKRVLEKNTPTCLLSFYGPTETTTFATALRIESVQGQIKSIPLGRPIANTQIYILDGRSQPAPIGVRGEIHIGGAGVAQGYLNLPELTAERFLTDPFRDDAAARMYKTGDTGAWRSDGTIEFFGRADFQVKVRGFRIEPGEIEARLREYPGIGEAVVIAREDDTGDKRLVVYYTLAEQEAGPTIGVEELRAHLLEVLPAYMVPSAYVQLKDLPLTRNGKVDRKGLPAPGDQAYGARGYEAPIGETETILAGIWSEVLGIERIGRHDNFFELGGHSLFVVRVIERMRRAGLHADVGALFTAPTLRALAIQSRVDHAAASAEGTIAIRATGTQRPLFLVHEFGGEGTYFSYLGAQIDSDVPVYGLPGVPLNDLQLSTMAALASRMVSIIHAVQPQGPYRIAGWSFGGLLAYEIAKQILSAGERVEFLGIVDRNNPLKLSSSDRQTLLSRAPQHYVVNFLLELDTGTADDEQRRTLDRLKKAAGELGLDDLVNECKQAGALSPTFETADDVRAFVSRMIAHQHALVEYVVEPIAAQLHLFFAEETFMDQVAASGPLMGWDTALGADQVRLIRLSGTHKSIMRPPGVANLGGAISAALANLDRD